MSVRRDLYLKAVEAAAILNTVEDDDERELLRDVFLQTFDTELHLGAQNRQAALALLREQLHLRNVT